MTQNVIIKQIIIKALYIYYSKYYIVSKIGMDVSVRYSIIKNIAGTFIYKNFKNIDRKFKIFLNRHTLGRNNE